MKDMRDFNSNDNGTTIIDLPPTDKVDILTGGNDDSTPFQRWRKKFKNYATYLTYKALNN
jgi:hypothetical protein